MTLYHLHQLPQVFQAGADAAEGEFLVFMDPSDTVSADALFEITRMLNENPEGDVVYCDRDTFDADGAHFDPVFLPDFSPELLRSHCYIGGFVAVRATLLEAIGGTETVNRNAARYDMVLRFTEKARQVCHVPRVLCHRRYAAQVNPLHYDEIQQEAARKALVGHCRRVGLRAEVLPTMLPGHFRVRHILTHTPKVSIIVPSKDDPECITKCIQSIYAKVDYRNLEVVIVDQASTDPLTQACYERLTARYDSLRVLTWEGEDNLSAISNFGAANTDGDYLLFLSGDARIVSDDFVQTMLGYFQSPDVGVVGPKRLFVDGTIDHAGLVVGGSRVYTPLFHFMPSHWHGYQNRAVVARNVTAVASDCMMVKRSIFDEVGGFTEEFSLPYAGIDFCCKTGAKGYYTVFSPYAVLSRFRGVSHTLVLSEALKVEVRREASLVQYRWPERFVKGDPFFNPNLDPDSPYYSLKY
jgi:GT2 family glycosyltransferase